MIMLRPEAEARRLLAVDLLEDAGADVSALAIERAHLLPIRDIVFDTTTEGREILVPQSDPERRSALASSMRDHLDRSTPTLVPMLIDHGGPVTGFVLDVEEADRGADVIYLTRDPSIRADNPYISGRFAFNARDDTGVVRAGFLREVSHVPTPQFAVGQHPATGSVYDSEESDIQVAASIGPNTGAARMTPEEVQAMIDASLAEFGEGMRGEITAALESLHAPAEGDDVAAAEGEGEEEEVAAAEGEGEEEEGDEVAASASPIKAAVEAAVAPLRDEIKGLRKAAEVKAGLAGQQFTPPPAGGGAPTGFADRIVHFKNQGMSDSAALAASRTPAG